MIIDCRSAYGRMLMFRAWKDKLGYLHGTDQEQRAWTGKAIGNTFIGVTFQ